jgi:sugar O-acyltransferase (sialic acid O-acetyltransferase NeuD family)
VSSTPRPSGWCGNLSDALRIVGLGAGGHAKAVLEIIAAVGGYDVVGLLDPRRELEGTRVGGTTVIGDDSLLRRQYDAGVRHAFIGLGGSGDTRPRRRLYELAVEEGFELVSLTHPTAAVSPSATIGSGATLLPLSAVQAGSFLDEDVIVNTGAIVEHDCHVGSHVHVASNATVASGVTLGVGVHVGAGATIRQGVRIGSGAVVGAGAVVVRDVDPLVVVAGVPARVLRQVEDT